MIEVFVDRGVKKFVSIWKVKERRGGGDKMTIIKYRRNYQSRPRNMLPGLFKHLS